MNSLDAISESLENIRRRQEELRPVYEEYLLLTKALDAIEPLINEDYSPDRVQVRKRHTYRKNFKERLMEKVIEEPGIGTRRLSEYFDVHRSTIFHAVRQLEREERIIRRQDPTSRNRIVLHPIEPSGSPRTKDTKDPASDEPAGNAGETEE